MTNDVRYPLARLTWSDKEYAAVERVLRSGEFTMGREVESFEWEFAAKLGRKHAIMVNSGSSANLVATAALTFRSKRPLAPGDEVIAPAVSWSTTYYPFHQYNLKLKLVDVNPRTFNIDMDSIRRAITPKTRLIVAVNLLGNPCEYDLLQAICDETGIELFEDNCEGLGAVYSGRKTGQFGVVSTHSLFFSHHISTMEGGVIVTDDDEVASLCRSLRAHGWTRGVGRDVLGYLGVAEEVQGFYKSFEFILPGYNVRPLELQAAIGRVQLARLDEFISTRRGNAQLMKEAIGSSSSLLLQDEVGQSSWFGFGFTMKPHSGISRDALVAGLTNAGVEVRPIVAGNVARQRVAALLNAEIPSGTLEGADVLHCRGFFVGNEGVNLQKEIEHFGAVLRQLENDPPQALSE